MQWKYPLPRKYYSVLPDTTVSLYLMSRNFRSNVIFQELKAFRISLRGNFPGNGYIFPAMNNQLHTLILPTCLLRPILIFWKAWYYHFIDSESHSTKKQTNKWFRQLMNKCIFTLVHWMTSHSGKNTSTYFRDAYKWILLWWYLPTNLGIYFVG